MRLSETISKTVNQTINMFIIFGVKGLICRRGAAGKAETGHEITG